VCGWAASVFLVLSAPPALAGPADGIAYDLEPYAAAQPILAAVYAAVTDPATPPATLVEAVAGIEAWIASYPEAPVEDRRLARWLHAEALHRTGRADEAVAAWSAIAESTGAFADHAARRLIEQAGRARRTQEAALLRLGRSTTAPGFPEDARRAVRDLERAKAHDALIGALDRALRGPMPQAIREDLLLALARAHRALRAPDRADALLREAWWRAAGQPVEARILTELRALRRPIHGHDTFARRILQSRRGDARTELRGLRRHRLPGRVGAAVREWGRALLERHDDDSLETALGRLEKIRPRLARTDFAPWWHFGMAEVLRRLDRDDEAVAHYLEVADGWPRHPGAIEALGRAAQLLRYLDRGADAAAVERRVIAIAQHGPVHRDALWGLGLGSWLEGAWEVAEQTLRELTERYGGEADRHSIMWAERALYWRARSVEAGGDVGQARALYAHVATRFPAGWYALLARGRLGGDPAPAGGALVVARATALDTAVALHRLGDREQAAAELEALLEAAALPGSGRALLAAIYTEQGDDVRAARVLRRGSVSPVPVHPEAAAFLRAWYPFDFADALASAANEHGISPALLAGIANVETRFRPKLRSPAGAIGLCQLMPRTGTYLGRSLFGPGFQVRQLWDPETNLRIAAYYLSRLNERFSAHPALVTAAYNAGNGPVRRWLEARGGLDTDAFVELIPFRQARRYVKRVLSTSEIYRVLYDLGDEALVVPSQVPSTASQAPGEP